MDNTKTGELIKELRKEKGMTQKDLAYVLNITDKAVSKWERGLCAPDISLLEPLSKALNLSIVDLIAGERIIETERIEEIEATTKSVIDYSKNEIVYKTKAFKKKYLIATAICVVTVVLHLDFLSSKFSPSRPSTVRFKQLTSLSLKILASQRLSLYGALELKSLLRLFWLHQPLHLCTYSS
jgi:transcriptional regulator with XRE-family HTH domain